MTRLPILGLAILAASGSPPRPDAGTHERPNFLVICSDQQHWEALGHVDPFFETPHLDAFAAQSVRFANAFCTTPQCSPSRASMLTGLYPHKSGVLGNQREAGGDPLAMRTVAAHLHDAGYVTGLIGKWHLGNHPAAAVGWDEMGPETRSQRDHLTTNRGIDFLRRHARQEQPFALFLMYIEPHGITAFGRRELERPAAGVPLPLSWEREDFADKPPFQKLYMEYGAGYVLWQQPRSAWQSYRLFYREHVKELDDEVGRVLAALRELELWEDTVVVVTSDHGDMDTHHRLVLKGPFMYDHMVRIPNLIRVPERFGGRGGHVERDHAWVNVDLTPTLLELAGAPLPACDGRSVKPLLVGADDFQPRRTVIGQFYARRDWIVPIRMIRTSRFKLNLYQEGSVELYDLEEDPHELVNLAGDEAYAEEQSELRAELERWIEQEGDPFFSLETTELNLRKQKRLRKLAR